MIYLDNNATTQPAPEVVEAMLPWLRENYGNASSPYRLGRRSEEAVENARAQLAALLGVRGGREIIFTAGATEANLTALHSALRLFPERRRVVTSAVEHNSVLEPLHALEKQGYDVVYLPVDAEGRLDPAEFEAALDENTALATLMWANNETGVLFPIPELAAIAREKRVPFHSDATQAVGKIALNPFEAGVGMLSLSGHKLHGPKGIGALWVNPRLRFSPLFPGSQEHERRAGTSNVPGIVGLGKAAELAGEHLAKGTADFARLRDLAETTLLARIPGSQVNGALASRLPQTCNLRFPVVEAEAMLLLLDQEDICVSTGSACTTGSLAPSHVLTAMGQDAQTARQAIRISLSRFSTEEEICKFCEICEKKWLALASS
jgi:cysteine desulfurase